MARPFRFRHGDGGVAWDGADFTWSANTRSEPLRTVDSVVGDADLDGGITINRVRWSGGVLTFNQTGGLWPTWIPGRGAWRFIVTVGTTDVVLTVSSRGGNGNGFIRWNLNAAQQAVLNGIDPGDEVRLQVKP